MARGTQNSFSVEQLIAELDESTDRAVAQLHAIFYVLGEDVGRAVLEETRAVEAAGGMRAPSGDRRTKGGVFFYLVRRRLTGRLRHRIFDPSLRTIAELSDLRPISSAATSAPKRAR